MKTDLKSIIALGKTLSPWVEVGEAGVGVVLGVLEGIRQIREREGRAPTADELHQLAVDTRADFEKLRKPKE